jgi:molybdate transport system regulatory protein
MSYKRAWELVSALNRAFARPVVAAQTGGRSGGGASLTEFGRDLVAHYRAIEAKAERSAALHLEAIQAVYTGVRDA